MHSYSPLLSACWHACNSRLQNIDLVLAYNREALAHTKRVKEPPEEAEEVFAQNSGLRRQLKQSLEETESANKACARARDALCEMEAQVQALEESLKDARGELGLARVTKQTMYSGTSRMS